MTILKDSFYTCIVKCRLRVMLDSELLKLPAYCQTHKVTLFDCLMVDPRTSLVAYL